MKKLLLTLCLLPLPAFASNWVTLGSNGNLTVKIDADSIARNGNEVTFWEIYNYSQRESDGTLSMKSNVVINCRTREHASKYIISHSDLDARGSVVSSGKASGQWSPIPPDSIIESEMKFVCKMK